MYKVQQWSGRLFKGSQEIPQDDREPAYLEYVEYLSAGGSVEVEDDRAEWELALASDPAVELESAEEWGRALVRQVELGLLASGINDDRKLALAVDRELAEIGAKLKDGRLHIALAALEELLERPESERHTPDDMLRPIEATIKARLKLEAERANG